MAGKKRAKKTTPAEAEATPVAAPPADSARAGEPAPPAGSVSDERMPPRVQPPIVGVVASAGGLDAFKKFFTALPPSSGIAFVLIPHLDPRHESLMPELLSRHSPMPVVEAQEGMRVEPNQVCVLPPNRYMTIAGGVLRLTGPVERGGLQTSIDLFLRSLADDQQERAICIIMSGTGAHGTLGLKAVKAAGGMAMVQDPKTAEYPQMPENAIATGLADYVLPPDRMPEALIKYVQHYYVNGGKTEAEVPDHLNQVLALLRARAGFDFRCYRKRMLARRVERRLGLKHIEHLPEYLTHLREHPDEIKQLARDLLISVTSFFRDAESFHALETEVIAPLIHSREGEVPLRIWVPGCATGEEPYSIAILLLEQLAAQQKKCPIQIFATDVDEEALEVARLGIYPDSIATDVSPERLTRFFTRANEVAYQVNKQIRELVVFAAQNLIADAPFSRLDLISCRNVLIYLEPEVQKKVISLFHFALNEGGYLFLGPSETIGRQTDLFEVVSKKMRVYRRIGPVRPERVEFPISMMLEHETRTKRSVGASTTRPVSFADLTQRLLLEDFAPAAVLVSRKSEVLYFFGPTGRYLEMPTGEPTQDLVMLAREGLRTKLRAGLQKAVRDGQPLTLPHLQMQHHGSYYLVTVTIKPVRGPLTAEGLLLVTFQEETPTSPPAPPLEPTVEDSLVRQLEHELRAVREDLQSTIEEMESSNEELKASNEEVMSMNEELQSANEELETSKEELQSLNEELTTVNSQLQEKVAELEQINNDMSNLLNCTDIPTVFLDMHFCLRRFSPATTQLLNLIVTDVGRPFSDIAFKFEDGALLEEAQQTLRDLRSREKEVQTEDQRWWLRRIIPYRTMDNRIEGVVLTFNDVTLLKQSSVYLEREVRQRTAALQEKEERLRAIVNTAADAILTVDQQGRIESVNPTTETLFGYQNTEMVGQPLQRLLLFPGKEPDYLTRRLQAGPARVVGLTREVLGRRRDDTTFPVDMTVSEVSAAQLFTVILRDITHRKKLEQEVVEIADLEKQRIGQDLHDSCGQELTALGLLTESLVQSLQQAAPEGVPLAQKIGAGIKRLLGQIRDLSRNLLEVDVAATSLPDALTALATYLSETAGLRCTFQGEGDLTLTDRNQARHLYHIAQEACTNACKHSQGNTIAIRLRGSKDKVVLEVQDNGTGLAADRAEGLGLHIMRNRASVIGARLTIAAARPQGTIVTCTLTRE